MVGLPDGEKFLRISVTVYTQYWRVTDRRTDVKTRMVGLPDGEKILRISVTVYTQYWRVTDRRTDGRTDTSDRQTSFHGIVRTMHTRRVVKTLEVLSLLRPIVH